VREGELKKMKKKKKKYSSRTTMNILYWDSAIF